jgi:hypothetical protein
MDIYVEVQLRCCAKVNWCLLRCSARDLPTKFESNPKKKAWKVRRCKSSCHGWEGLHGPLSLDWAPCSQDSVKELMWMKMWLGDWYLRALPTCMDSAAEDPGGWGVMRGWGVIYSSSHVSLMYRSCTVSHKLRPQTEWRMPTAWRAHCSKFLWLIVERKGLKEKISQVQGRGGCTPHGPTRTTPSRQRVDWLQPLDSGRWTYNILLD